ncbi:MAG: PorP/SprF family type IX secretion system membrane protein [Ekhidna sp.]|nr:PorP/SprF family type IX secretion system membrane protein [Ekhidna sp.]
MFNPSYYNPAWVGTEKEAFVAFHHRSQWAGYDASFDPEGAPSTQLLSLVVPVQSVFSGVGMSISNDRSGPLNTIQVRASISIRKELGFGALSLGVMPAINSAAINANYRFVDDGDNSIPDGGESQTKPNLHAGIYYRSPQNHFIGISAENLLEPSFDFGADVTNRTEISYLFTAGTYLSISRELAINPTILIRSDFNALTYDIGFIAVYEERMWGGVAFRRSDAISLLLGYSFFEGGKLKAGYSFDYIIKDRDAKQPTSHEIFVRYNLPELVFGGRKAVKTPRFTF